MKISTSHNVIRHFNYGYTIVGCSFLILMVSFGANYSFGVFFNPLLSDLGWSRAVTAVGYSIAQLFGGMIGIITGRFSDSFGPKVTVVVCGCALTLGCLLMSQVAEVWQLYIFYGILVGMGFGGTVIPLSSTISRWFTLRRGLMTGIVISGIGTGTVIMPLVANRLLASFSWQTSFLIIGAIVFVFVVPAALLLKRDPSKVSNGYRGVLKTIVPARVADSGITWRNALRTGQFWIFCLICILFGFNVQSIIVHIVPHAKQMGIEAGSAALVLSFLGIGSIVGRIVMGNLSDRIGVRYTMIIALGIMLLTLLLLQIAAVAWTLCLFALIFGFTYGALIAMQTLAPAKMFGIISLGTLVGIVTFMYTAGGSIGAVITGFVFDVSESYRWAFIICAILAAVALTLAMGLRTNEQERDS